MNASLSSPCLRRLRKAPLFVGLAFACAGIAAQAAERDRASRFEQRLDAHRTQLRGQLSARAAAAKAAAARPSGATAVTTCDDSGPGSLREAFANAVSGDLIDLGALTCSSISLTGGALATSVDDLSVQGPGASQLAIDGGGLDRIIDHTGAGTLSIAGLTLRNGSYVYDRPPVYNAAAHGGCVLSAGSVTIDASALEQCNASGGAVTGGAVMALDTVTLTSSTITGTTATARTVGFSAGAYGGVVYADRVYLDDSTISGAAVSVTGTDTAFSGSIGGGVLAFVGVAMTHSTVTGVDLAVSAPKDAYAEGGGIAARMAVILDSSTVSNNTVHATPGIGRSGPDNAIYHSSIAGGGLYIGRTPEGTPLTSTITNSTISGNAALVDGAPGDYTYNGGGGLISQAQMQVTIANSTVSGNTAALAGGGIYLRNFGALILANATITDNTAASGSAIADAGGRSSYGLIANSSLVAGNHASAAATPEITTIHTISGAHNLIASANVDLPDGTLTVDPLLGPLADNGGPTRTHALLTGSPAIDAGANAEALDTDQRGQGYLRVFGTTADIGAFEWQPLSDTIFADGFD